MLLVTDLCHETNVFAYTYCMLLVLPRKSTLRCMSTSPSFSAMFSKGYDFCDFLFAYLEDEVFQKWGQLSGFIRVREMSGKLKIFQGQGIVREFHNLSGKIEFLLKCQGDVREF